MAATLKEKLNTDLRQAMKSGDAVRRSTIRLLLSAVHYAEIARQVEIAEQAEKKGTGLPDGTAKQVELEDAEVLGVIAKQAKQREESILAYKQGNRPDLVAQEEAELAVLKEYLPRQLTREEIAAEARRVIAEVDARGPGDKGKVMPKVIAQLKGRADGREINTIVTEILNSM